MFRVLRLHLGRNLSSLTGLWLVLNTEIRKPNFGNLDNRNVIRKCVYINIYLTYRSQLSRICKEKAEIGAFDSYIGNDLANLCVHLDDEGVVQALYEQLFNICLRLGGSPTWPIHQYIRDNCGQCCK